MSSAVTPEHIRRARAIFTDERATVVEVRAPQLVAGKPWGGIYEVRCPLRRDLSADPAPYPRGAGRTPETALSVASATWARTYAEAPNG